jgi:hypothetical protein
VTAQHEHTQTVGLYEIAKRVAKVSRSLRIIDRFNDPGKAFGPGSELVEGECHAVDHHCLIWESKWSK